ncbi:MAG TPA: GFA family protein [Casimicrobiaceae bacterium]|nr:GFA family protein [Casimicrobiaceae bacterium]
MANTDESAPAVRATGACLCGAVRYEVLGPLRDVIECHCAMCRKTHGHIGAYTATPKDMLRIVETRGLKWYRSSEKARRGFCVECGGTLFYDPLAKDYMAIAAGTLDPPTGLKTALQIHVASAGDYYAVDPSIRQRAD